MARTQEVEHVPNNRAQNRAFRDATQGLTHAQKEQVRREVESNKQRYENYDYHTIKELAEEIARNRG